MPVYYVLMGGSSYPIACTSNLRAALREARFWARYVRPVLLLEVAQTGSRGVEYVPRRRGGARS